MERTLICETIDKVGETVFLKGWVQTRRDHGKITFLDLSDRSGIVQVVAGGELAKDIGVGFAVAIEGKVKQRPENLINPKLATGTLEIGAEKIEILAKSEPYPFDMGKPDLDLELPTLLDYRALTLRHPKIKPIFKVQETVIDAFREGLKKKDFTEFQAPVIIPQTAEGGAEVFEVKYFEHKAYLAQSPQFYKQIMVGVFERVFAVNKTLRAEPSVTTRHLTEVTTLDAEFGFIDSWLDVMRMAEYTIKYILDQVAAKCADILSLYDVAPPKVLDEIPYIKLREAQEIIFKRTGRDNRNEPDLQPEDEKEICRWSAQEKGSDLVFVTHYPVTKRPFYTFEDPEDLGYTLSFDLIGKGTEWMTGGQRINNYESLVEKAKERGVDTQKSDLYLQAFRYGMPPEGGYSFGSERIVMDVLGLKNIREASPFPRDMERVDIRLSALKGGGQNNTKVFDAIKDLLNNSKIRYQLFEHEPVYTSEDAAKVRGTKLEQGAKALVIFADDEPVMVVLPANLKLDTKAFKSAYEVKNLRMGTPNEVENLTGCQIGAVPPFGNIFKLPLYVDPHLGDNEEIAFNAGMHTKSVKMKYADFIKIAKPIFGDFAVSQTG